MPSYTCHDAQSSTRFVPAYNELLRCLKLRGALVDEPYKARNATVTRLIAIENATHREEYDYDYMGRRWRLKTFAKSGNDWTLTVEKRFVYDGYRQIAEFTMNGTTPTLTATYLWQPGLDGIVLRATFGTNVRYFIPDGNRNILQLRDASGAVTDSYAYGPFGQCAAAGTTPNPFRFSCEYLDGATGLVYYNYRHYHPRLGRWTSRDPSEEEADLHPYEMCLNTCIHEFDSLGLWRGAVHVNLTEEAFFRYWRDVKYIWMEKYCITFIDSSHIADKIYKLIVNANVNTDSFFGKAWYQEYHFCTNFWYRNCVDYKLKYSNTLENESDNWKKRLEAANPSVKDCKEALETLGILTHMWQDYYAHGVEYDPHVVHKDEKQKRKFSIGRITGNPEEPSMDPVTFGALGFVGKHGGFFRLFDFFGGYKSRNPLNWVEPGERATDRDNRLAEAKEFTYRKFTRMMPVWMDKCNCMMRRFIK